MDDDDYLCDDLDAPIAVNLPVTLAPVLFWPPDSEGLWPGTFPVAEIRSHPTASHGMPF